MKQQSQHDHSSNEAEDTMNEHANNEKPQKKERKQTEFPAKDDKKYLKEIETLKEAAAVREQENKSLSDQYLRLMAEYDNFRRRSQKEKEALYEDSVAEVVREWLPVLDNLDRAEFSANQYHSEEARKIAEGITMIRKQAYEILDALGVQPIDCCGQPFDPNLHNAVMHVEDESLGVSTVVEEFTKGYVRKDRVIRHSVVKVAN